MSQNPSITVAHFGICTSDVKRSITFYSEALGFVLDHSIEDIGQPFDVLTKLPGLKIDAYFLKQDGVTIELIGYQNPSVTGATEPRPMNQLGLTHMSLVVDDIDAVTERIAKYGGHVLGETKIDTPAGGMIFCTDPDGVRIELMEGRA